MSGQAPNSRAPPKHLYGAAKIEEHAVERTRRRDEHEEAALEHDRRTKASRAKFAWFAERQSRLKRICDDSEREIKALASKEQALRQKMQESKERLELHEAQYGGDARFGERDAAISAKYKAYLEMESDDLGL